MEAVQEIRSLESMSEDTSANKNYKKDEQSSSFPQVSRLIAPSIIVFVYEGEKNASALCYGVR